MNRIIKLIIAASCIFSLIAFPVACGSDDATEHKAPAEEVKPEVEAEAKPEAVTELKATEVVEPEVKPEVEEVKPEVEHEATPEEKH